MNYYLFVLLGFIGGFGVTYLVIPKIIGIVKYKKLFDDPNDRSSHKEVTPTLGGSSFFLALIFSLFFIRSVDTSDIAFHFVPALTILFIMGLKDDLLAISPLTKILGQLLAIAFMLYNPSLELFSLHGFLGIYEIPLVVNYLLSGFIMIAIINAVNLIDGIDGLAGMLGFVILSVFGLLFYITGQQFFTLMAVTLAGSLSAFLRYNLSGKQKIFMGDTGSMILGFVIATMTIKLLALRTLSQLELPFKPEVLPIIALSILIVPIFDTARVFILRLRKGQSPFHPDRNHVHHLLIDHLHLSHRRASFVMALFSFVFVSIMLFLGSTVENYLYLGAIFLVSFGFLFVTAYRVTKGFSKLKHRMFVRKRLKAIRSANNGPTPPMIVLNKKPKGFPVKKDKLAEKRKELLEEMGV